MTNNYLRVMILDSIHAQSMQLEKMLNRMGYYSIATSSSLDECVKLSFAGPKRFDLLLAAEPMLRLEQCPSTGFGKFEISNLFAYSCPSLTLEVKWAVMGESCYRNGMPEYEVLEQFMARLMPTSGGFRHNTARLDHL